MKPKSLTLKFLGQGLAEENFLDNGVMEIIVKSKTLYAVSLTVKYVAFAHHRITFC